MKYRLKDFWEDYGILFFVFGTVALMFGLAAAFDPEDNTDPRKGTVWIQHSGITKRCDGTTLIYNGEGTQIVLNSSECM